MTFFNSLIGFPKFVVTQYQLEKKTGLAVGYRDYRKLKQNGLDLSTHVKTSADPNEITSKLVAHGVNMRDLGESVAFKDFEWRNGRRVRTRSQTSTMVEMR
jgi:hypothetical protein